MNKRDVLSALLLSEQQQGLLRTLKQYYGANIKISIGYTHHACVTEIDALCFSVRSQNALKRAGFFTVGNVIDALNQDRLTGIRNLGRKSICEIKTRVLLFGFEQLSEREKIQFFHSVIELNPEKTAALCAADPQSA